MPPGLGLRLDVRHFRKEGLEVFTSTVRKKLCDLEHAVCGCVCFRVKAVMCHCQCNMFAFLVLSLSLSLFLPLSAPLLLISAHHSSGLEPSPGLFFFILPVPQKRKKPLPLSLQSLQFFRGAALIFQHASNVSPGPQIIFQFIYFNISAGSPNPNWLPVVPARVQELVGKNRAGDSLTQFCCC